MRAVGREGDGVEVEHEVGDHRADAGADDLGGDVGDELARGEAAEEAVGEGDDGVEVGARHRPEGEDERDEPAGGGGRVLEQLQADVVGREPLGEDARADDDGDEQAGADRLGGEPAAEGRGHRLSSTAGAARRRPGALLGQSGERAGRRRRGRRARAGSRSSTGTARSHEAGLAEDPQVVAHQGLGHAELLDEVADAELLVGEQLDDPPAQRLGERLQRRRRRRIHISRHRLWMVVDVDGSAQAPRAPAALSRRGRRAARRGARGRRCSSPSGRPSPW